MDQVIKACEVRVFIESRLGLLVVQFHKFMTRSKKITHKALLDLAE